MRSIAEKSAPALITHGSLFSGMGGFDLAAEWMGWENVFHCEWNPFGQKILKYYWPEAISYDDITKTDFTIHRGQIDILTGGFPCQPFSAAGKRKGTADDRHLWPEMLRAIREIKPTWIVGENVSGIISWDGGLVFQQVQIDLETEGYEVQAVVLPACGVGAPHRRDRVWFIAYAKNWGINGIYRNDIGQTAEDGYRDDKFNCNGIERNAPNTNNERLQQQSGNTIPNKSRQPCRIFEKAGFESFPTQSPVCSRNDGIPSRLDGITFPKWRNESIKAAGNAIVPQVALQIFKAIADQMRED